MRILYKYKELGEPCKSAIAEGRCTGCNRLELENFVGLKGCKYAKEERKNNNFSKDWKIC